jgi:hypothetical protein
MNVDTKSQIFPEGENPDNVSLIPSSYNKIESFDEIISPNKEEQKMHYSSFSNKESKKSSSNKIAFPASIYSMVSFNWVKDIVKTTKKKHKMKYKYLGDVSEDYKSKEVLNEIKPRWYGKYNVIMHKNIKENKRSISPLVMTLITGNLRKIIFSLSIFFIMSILDYLGVLIFEELLGRFKENKNKPSRVLFLQSVPLYKLVIYMILYKFFSLILDRQALFISELLAFRTKAQLNLLIYDKLLKIPLFNTGKFNEGQIINLFQIDSEAFGELVDYTTYIIMVPFRIIYSVYLLFVFF